MTVMLALAIIALVFTVGVCVLVYHLPPPEPERKDLLEAIEAMDTSGLHSDTYWHGFTAGRSNCEFVDWRGIRPMTTDTPEFWRGYEDGAEVCRKMRIEEAEERK